ncbi:cys-loop ligand-gated ion channel-like [Babylonia areolata]|uniref:cys-loop ligand-gated ion channel-like n=1 Tax=Babylonia areolata TaxID=304850 RepID=UPI003FD3AAF7
MILLLVIPEPLFLQSTQHILQAYRSCFARTDFHVLFGNTSVRLQAHSLTPQQLSTAHEPMRRSSQLTMDTRNPLSHPPGIIPTPPKRKKNRRTSSSATVDLHGVYNPASPLGSPAAMATPRKPRVYVRVVFLKIGEINTLKEQFHAEVFVQARWREPMLDGCQNVDDVQWEDLWNPQLQLENAMNDPKTSLWHDVSLTDSGEAYVLEKRRVKADFCETLELHSFPFDVQHLSVLITSRLSDKCLELLEDDQELSAVNLLSFVDEQEWDVRDLVESIPEVRTREFSAVRHRFPILTVRTYAIRRAGFFAWNVLAIMVMICSLSLCTFAISRSLPQNRLQLSFTLVLTGVAFKFVVGQSLPRISYLTVLDKYILGSMLLMHLVSVWHAVLTRVSDSWSQTLDDWAFVIFVLAFCLYNLGFAVVMIVKTKVLLHASRQGLQSQGRVIKKSRLTHNSKVDTV